MVEALAKLAQREKWKKLPVSEIVAATSVGIVDGRPLLDLCYEEDCNAQVDMNIVMTERGNIVEIQGAAEGWPFIKDELYALIDLAEQGITQLVAESRKALSDILGGASS